MDVGCIMNKEEVKVAAIKILTVAAIAVLERVVLPALVKWVGNRP
jgi:hypothetical protein